MEGITDAQAREMATNLEFKGTALDKVSKLRTCSNDINQCSISTLNGSQSCSLFILLDH